MGRAALAAAWLAACSPLALAWIVGTGADRFAGTSFVALASLGWLFLASMPRTLAATGSASRTHAFGPEIAAFSLFLPPLAAAAGLDIAQGGSTGRTLALAIGVAVAALVLADAARRAATDQRTARIHAIAWFALVAGPPLALYALEAGGGPFLGRAPRWIEWLSSASPLGAAVANARDISVPLHVSWGLPLVLVGIAALPALISRTAREDAA